MAVPVATLSTFTRQFDAPEGVNAQRYAANHGNDFSKKITTTCEDVCNTVMDFVDWLFSGEKESFNKLLLSNSPLLPRTFQKEDSLATKQLEVGRLDNEVMPALLNNINRTSFDVKWDTCSGKKKVVFTQPPKDASVKYVLMESYLIEGEGEQKKLTKIDSKILFGKTFLDVYHDLNARLEWQ